MFVDVSKIDLLKFKGCEGCSECCKKPFAPLVLDDFKKVYENFAIVLVDIVHIRPMMVIAKDKACKYLENEKCLIYEERPPACRIYPFSPFFDKLYLDVGCKGVGIEGDFLPMDWNEFRWSDFFDERFIKFEEKLLKTNVWLEGKKFKKAGKIRGMEYFVLEEIEDEYDKMHLDSLKNL
ncbi:YkgJ family cysteine cluster protein [Caminibacter sp.]